MEWIPVLVVAVLVLIVIVRNIYVVQQSRAYVIERLGAFSAVWQFSYVYIKDKCQL